MGGAARFADRCAVSAEKGRSLAVNKRKILESAQKHLQRGALDKALEDYQTLLKADPKDSNIRLKVGDLHLKLGRAQDAIDAYLRVAQQFTNEGFDAKAVALYKQITKLDDKRFEVHAQLGELYQRMGLASEAMKAIQLAADGAHRVGDKNQALGLLRRMAALDPTNTASRLKVADLLRTEGKTEDALAEYDEVVRELERQNNVEEQIRVIERALEIEPTRPESLRALARAAIEASVPAKAERAAAALIAANADDLEAIELRGTALDRLGRTDEAAEVFRGLAEKFRARGDEDRARALMQRWAAGEVFDIGGSDATVLEGDSADLEIDPDLDASLGIGPDDRSLDDAVDEPADALADETFEPSEGLVEATESAVEGEDEGEGAGEADGEADLDQLLAEASVFARYGKHERAIETLRSALRVEPGNAAALERLGESLIAIGNRAHAASTLTRAGNAYAEAGLGPAVERVRGLLAPIDAKAAAALPKVAAAPAPPAEETSELDIEIDADLEDETMTPVASPPAGDLPREADDDFSGIDIDVSADLEPVAAEAEAAGDSAQDIALDDEPEDPEITFDVSEPEPEAEPEPEPPPTKRRAAAPAAVAAPVAKAPPPAPAADPDQDFEEAEFYREQGMLDEARGLYERVLAASPEHARARARLAEIKASSTVEMDVPAIAASDPAPASEPDEVSFEIDVDGAEAEDDTLGNARAAAARERAAAAAPPPAPEPEPAPKAAPTPKAEVKLAPAAAPIVTPPAPAATPKPEVAPPPQPTREAIAAPEIEEPVAAAAEPSLAVEPEPEPAAAAALAPHPAEDAHEAAAPIAAADGADFDLAAELSGALGEEPDGRTPAQTAESEGFEEVFAAFKAGVKREVGDGDTEAHYDLGIAYKEMGLLEDAIGEFRIALADAGRRIPCLHLMGVCALELGRGPDAVAHLSEALSGGPLPAEQEAALRVDLGRAHHACGDVARARVELEAARAAEPSFAGIERLLAELATAAPAPVAEPAEALESFDDLMEDDAVEAAVAPAAEPQKPQYESFDELMSDDAAEALAAAEPPGATEDDDLALAPEAASEIELREEVTLAPPPAEEPAPEAAAPETPEPRPEAAPAPTAPSAPAPAAPAAAPARRKKKISFV